ncbi:hypothetical protein LRQ08_31675 (plasmid) [Rhodococcus qingshengii]|uniref:hypothetical protein n=1 Tax=Rhodococcus qingshengii TaxID=334542 RepID=UPI002111D5F2|nr:hypothetical protein [Rhodococcus qingshengii]UUE28494.1 hypothetical protein LRQ08_31675 [Rhodococcus qingshengii]
MTTSPPAEETSTEDHHHGPHLHLTRRRPVVRHGRLQARQPRAPALNQPQQVEDALGHAVTGLLGIIAAMHTAVESLEKELARGFDAHPLEPILRSAPGLGPLLAARF